MGIKLSKGCKLAGAVSGIMLFSVISCTSEREKIHPPVNNHVSIQEKPLPEEYLQEGFINRDTFRIVIVTPAKTPEEAVASIESRARTRAVSVLKNYIQTRGWDFTDRTRGELFRLILSNGTVTHMERDNTRDSVFVYDIRKGNIQNEIDLIASRR